MMTASNKGETIRHEMIMASAGSGKTYQLTNRILKLLALGVEPERINALTFTKKAAGEFFDTVLAKLATASEESEHAAKLASELDLPGLGRDDFLVMLARLVGRLHLISFGTLDSFFHRIVRNFPFEFGLTGDFGILDEDGVNVERRRVLQEVFHGYPLKAEVYRRFFEAFKQATWGTEERSLVRLLNRFVDENHAIFLRAPEREKWGDPERIWPDGSPWLEAQSLPEAELDALARIAEEKPDLNDKQRGRWRAFIDGVRQWQPGAPFPGDVKYFLEKCLREWEPIGRRDAVLINERRREVLSPEQCKRLESIVKYLVGGSIGASLRVTRGIYDTLWQYDVTYSRLVRRQGRLTFQDVLLLLNGRFANDEDSSGLTLTQTDDPTRLAVHYRLDSQYDHWLLDEFQDTSFEQWRILQPLIDEVIQDPTGQRSFFYVGDVKQSIFGWRGGDPRLFRDVYSYYNQWDRDVIVERRMNESRRCGPAVIESVNTVFGNEGLFRELFPKETVDRWSAIWDVHGSSRSEEIGYAALYEVENEAERFASTVGLLEEIQPIEKGLSCAILVQRNEVGEQLAQYIREYSNIAVTSESDIRIGRDNPLSVALLSLLKVAAHPKDSFAWEHLRMTPFNECLRRMGFDKGRLIESVLTQIYREGFEATVAAWIDKLNEVIELDRFSQGRAKELITAAYFFDRLGKKTVAEFLDFIDRYRIRDVEATGQVQVMTVHKAKGLGFDVVLLPDLEGKRLAQRRSGLGVQETSEREIAWVLDLPPKEVREMDRMLHENELTSEAEACFERLCDLYVAMTRAKQALYLIAGRVGSSKSINYPKLLDRALASSEARTVGLGQQRINCYYEAGIPEWYQRLGGEPPREEAGREALAEEETALTESGRELKPGGQRLRRRTSSDASQSDVLGDRLFSLETRQAADYGTLVHWLFEQIEWLTDETEQALEASLQRSSAVSTDQKTAALNEVFGCLREPTVRATLQRPSSPVEVWREKRFEIVMDGEWISGVFDRVTLIQDGNGGYKEATILDFKTDRLSGETDVDRLRDLYSPQLRLYRQVLSRISGLSESRIRCRLLITQRRQLVDV